MTDWSQCRRHRLSCQRIFLRAPERVGLVGERMGSRRMQSMPTRRRRRAAREEEERNSDRLRMRMTGSSVESPDRPAPRRGRTALVRPTQLRAITRKPNNYIYVCRSTERRMNPTCWWVIDGTGYVGKQGPVAVHIAAPVAGRQLLHVTAPQGTLHRQTRNPTLR